MRVGLLTNFPQTSNLLHAYSMDVVPLPPPPEPPKPPNPPPIMSTGNFSPHPTLPFPILVPVSSKASIPNDELVATYSLSFSCDYNSFPKGAHLNKPDAEPDPDIAHGAAHVFLTYCPARIPQLKK